MSALHERRFTAELRRRGSDGVWSSVSRRRDVTYHIDALIDLHPSPAWDAAAARIAALKRGDHTRVDLDADTAILLERI
jgi:hypothetical protein